MTFPITKLASESAKSVEIAICRHLTSYLLTVISSKSTLPFFFFPKGKCEADSIQLWAQQS